MCENKYDAQTEKPSELWCHKHHPVPDLETVWTLHIHLLSFTPLVRRSQQKQAHFCQNTGVSVLSDLEFKYFNVLCSCEEHFILSNHEKLHKGATLETHCGSPVCSHQETHGQRPM